MLDTLMPGDLAQFTQHLRPARKIIEAHMGGQGQALGANRLDVQVMDFPHSRNTREPAPQAVQIDMRRNTI